MRAVQERGNLSGNGQIPLRVKFFEDWLNGRQKEWYIRKKNGLKVPMTIALAQTIEYQLIVAEVLKGQSCSHDCDGKEKKDKKEEQKLGYSQHAG